jgi:DNA polymerase-3 subunit epsilon
MLALFNRPWEEIPIVVIDVETTGVTPGVDAIVQIAFVRFEKRKVVGRFSTLVNPGEGRTIPAEATAVHGITDEKVAKAPAIGVILNSPKVQKLLGGAQPAAYNAQFDQRFVPAWAFEDWMWPWLDPLVAIRAVDRYVKGKRRHTLTSACERRGIKLKGGAHDAAVDAEATGRLLYHVFSEVPAIVDASLGTVIAWQRRAEADQWENFNKWRASQPDET